MQHCLDLARKGLGHVAPNPMVGAVLVYNDRIVAEGYHEQYGKAHAEVNAFNNLKDSSVLSQCTLYVNLEPCAHHGKTPPCADLVIQKGVKRLVVGNLDTNPLVAGKGIARIRAAGIDVTQGILDKECRELNRRFFTFHEQKRPYVILKWAQTGNGFISRNPLPESKEDNWITGPESKRLVHQWRSEEQAILVGRKTVEADNPQLTTRLIDGKSPLRLVIDKDLKLDSSLAVFNAEAHTIVFTALENEDVSHIRFVTLDFSRDIIPQILRYLHEHGISSLIVEGGTTLLQSFIDLNVWDEARVFVNTHKVFETGLRAPHIRMAHVQPINSGTDQLYIIQNL
ncbi:MAG: bifunctional diaminohydroxyphosphoribosylaminopyrimidine deaminase/5-amino-6-(5-phosphoribosylamino)uracil reductase RibD [Bacteroidetes bacterium]|nr:bifunctional diaminohydroxyphosphoribosylaminopyrimidine deaminase/5-amino-6-(5-phosphoribosylamino)uracil reductase RibD [Bacteroidota bacterium]